MPALLRTTLSNQILHFFEAEINKYLHFSGADIYVFLHFSEAEICINYTGSLHISKLPIVNLPIISNLPIESLYDISKLPTETNTCYSIAKALVYSLMQDAYFASVSEEDKSYIISKILDDVKGRMLEDIVLLEVGKAKSPVNTSYTEARTLLLTVFRT